MAQRKNRPAEGTDNIRVEHTEPDLEPGTRAAEKQAEETVGFAAAQSNQPLDSDDDAKELDQPDAKRDPDTHGRDRDREAGQTHGGDMDSNWLPQQDDARDAGADDDSLLQAEHAKMFGVKHF